MFGQILLDYSRSLRLNDASEESSEVVANAGAVLTSDETTRVEGEEEGEDNGGMESRDSEEEEDGSTEDGSQEIAEDGENDSDN